jgi:hypothetical protein
MTIACMRSDGCAPMVRLLAVGLLVIATAAVSSAQTRELLDAPRVKSRIRIRADPRTRQISYAVDEERVFRTLPARPVFRLAGAISVTYAAFNPLRVHVIAASPTPPGGTVQRSADPLDVLASSLSTVVPRRSASTAAPPAASGSCPKLDAAFADADLLARSIYGDGGAMTFGDVFDGWRTEVDMALAAGRSGPNVIGDVVDEMKGFAREMTSAIDAASPLVLKLERARQETSGGDSCDAAAASMYRAIRLTNPRARMQQLVALSAVVSEFSDSLSAEYGEAATFRWHGADYVIREAVAQDGDLLRMTVTIDAVDFDLQQPGGPAVNRATTHAAATIELRRTSRFVREFGLGTAVSSVVRPKYGTSSNAPGQTILARLPPGKILFSPVVAVNLTCLCDTGPLVTPMLQAGLSTSPDAPGLFAGGGIRLFGIGTGDVALGGGWISGWVQDLKTLRVGDRVGGTIDIDRDLGFARRDGWYVLAQYKF